MKRPAFQFYPKDWSANLKLRRCSDAAKGAWIEILCFLHQSEEYGVARFFLREIVKICGVKSSSVRELVDKGVLEGGDADVPAFMFTPRHAGKQGVPVVLLESSQGPMWYCSRFVEDEYKRKTVGVETRFKPTIPTTTPPGRSTPSPTPSRRDGAGQGDGSAFASASAVRSINGLGVLAAGALAQPVDNPEPRRIDSTSTPRAAAHSIANTERVKAENAIARARAVPPPPGLVKRKPASIQ